MSCGSCSICRCGICRESIRRRKWQEPLPAALQKLREYQWQARNKYSPSELFVLQGKAAENYSDETVHTGPCLHYYPSYSALSDSELRGYFGWRTRVRRGQVEPSNLTFYILYANELINLIGVKSPEEGYERLLKLRDDYGPKEPTLIMRLNEWLFSFHGLLWGDARKTPARRAESHGPW